MLDGSAEYAGQWLALSEIIDRIEPSRNDTPSSSKAINSEKKYSEICETKKSVLILSAERWRGRGTSWCWRKEIRPGHM
jgi:hypothetical protein